MDITATISLFLAMTFLALVPGPGVFIVVSRSMSRGHKAGLITSMGIVCGDYVFILLAVFGLSFLSHILGSLFFVIKYLGAAYLIWLGISIMRAKNNTQKKEQHKNDNRFDFLAGLISTLANPKAILFYVSFFPSFVDLNNILALDIFIIFVVATISIFGTMYFFVYTTLKAEKILGNTFNNKIMQYGSGSLLLGSGAYIAFKSQ